jgi:hypothetical protein
MDFEFDDHKGKGNKEKHGIDFIEAEQIRDDPVHMEIPARTEDEPRYLVIGKIGEKCWSAVITLTRPGSRLGSVTTRDDSGQACNIAICGIRSRDDSGTTRVRLAILQFTR